MKGGLEWMVLALLVMAGCLDAPDEASVGDEHISKGGVRGDGNLTVRDYAGRFDLTVSGIEVPGFSFGLAGANCVDFDGNAMKILNGTAVATWSPSLPTHDRFRVGITLFGGQGYEHVVTGTSPLELEIPEGPMVSGGAFDDYVVSVEPPEPVAVVYEQHIRLEIRLTVEAAGDVVGHEAGCSVL